MERHAELHELRRQDLHAPPVPARDPVELVVDVVLARHRMLHAGCRLGRGASAEGERQADEGEREAATGRRPCETKGSFLEVHHGSLYRPPGEAP